MQTEILADNLNQLIWQLQHNRVWWECAKNHVPSKEESYHSINSSLQEYKLAAARSSDSSREARNLHFYVKASDF